MSYGQYNVGAFWKGSCSGFTYFQSANSGTVSTGTTASATLTPTAGHFLVALVHYTNNLGNAYQGMPPVTASVTDTLGNTWNATAPVSDPNYYDETIQLWFAPVTSGGSSDTITLTTGTQLFPSMAITVSEYSGIALTNSIDVTSGTLAPTTSTTLAPGAVTTTASCDLVVGGFRAPLSPVTPAAGFTKRTSASHDDLQDGAPSGVTAGTSINTSATISSGSYEWTATQAAFRAAGSTFTVPAPTQAAFTAAPQTLKTWNCAAYTVQLQNGSAQPQNTETNVTLALSGTNVNYFADSACELPITSATIWAGSNSQTIYAQFSDTSPGQVAVAPTGYSSISQTETVSIDPYTWVGGASCDNNWTTAACWQGGSAPNSSKTAHFDGHCSSNCAPALSGNVTTGAVWLHSNFSGSLSLNSNTLTVSSGIPTKYFQFEVGAQIDGGTLNLNSGTLSAGPQSLGFQMTGGTLNGGSGNLLVCGNYGVSGGTFNVGTSTVTTTNNGNTTLSGSGTLHFYNLVFGNNNGCSVSAPLSVANNLSDTYGCQASFTTTIGGNLIDSVGGFSSASVVFTSGASHSITGSHTWPILTMDDSSVTTADTLTFQAGTTTTVNTTLTLKGNSTHALSLQSSTPGTQWSIDPQSAVTVNQVNVQDSDNTATSPISATASVNSGNNTNWGFAPTLVNSAATNDASCTTCHITIPSTAAGDLIVLAATMTGVVTVTGVSDNGASGGSTYASAVNSSTNCTSNSVAIWYAASSALGATTITFNLSSAATPPTWEFEFSNPSAASLDVANSSQSTTNHTTITGATITTTGLDEALVSVAYAGATISGIKSGNYFTAGTIENGDDAAYYLPLAAGTYGAIWSQSPTSNYCTGIAAFK